jgi:putative oxidoreductase
MEKALASFAPYASAILRIIVGLLFVSHGGQKTFGWFGGQLVPVGSLFGLAGIVEIVLGLLVTIGLLTSYAAFIASGEMAVAYFIGQYPKSFSALQNEGEAVMLFCFVLLYMATRVLESGVSMRRGAVEVSIMKRRRSRKRNSEYLAQSREAAKQARFDFWI